VVRALLTNDDGISSLGLATLARAALEAGLDLTIAAPHQERSGSGAALSAVEDDGHLLVDHAEVAGVPALAVHASPAMIAFVGVQGAFGERPDIVLSGVNHGPNAGHAVLHSGTVGAALTAVTQGIPAMAVSLDGADPQNFETAGTAAVLALRWFLDHRDVAYVLNLNVPDIAPGDLKGIRRAEPSTFGAVQAVIGEPGEGFVTVTFEESHGEPEPGTDLAALRAGWASVTALGPPSPAGGVDLSSLDGTAPA